MYDLSVSADLGTESDRRPECRHRHGPQFLLHAALCCLTMYFRFGFRIPDSASRLPVGPERYRRLRPGPPWLPPPAATGSRQSLLCWPARAQAQATLRRCIKGRTPRHTASGSWPYPAEQGPTCSTRQRTRAGSRRPISVSWDLCSAVEPETTRQVSYLYLRI